MSIRLNFGSGWHIYGASDVKFNIITNSYEKHEFCGRHNAGKTVQ